MAINLLLMVLVSTEQKNIKTDIDLFNRRY